MSKTKNSKVKLNGQCPTNMDILIIPTTKIRLTFFPRLRYPFSTHFMKKEEALFVVLYNFIKILVVHLSIVEKFIQQFEGSIASVLMPQRVKY